MCARARARARPGEGDRGPRRPGIARRSAAAAAPPRPGPAPGPARPPPRMELSAIGEQVFAVESIRKKRVRKVRLPGGRLQDPVGSPSVPSTVLYPGGEGESGGEETQAARAAGPVSQPVPQFPPPPCRERRIKSCRPRMLRAAEPARAGD